MDKFRRAHITDKVRHEVYAKASYACLVCGFHNDLGMGLSVDHIIPVAEGGSNSLSNYQCLCAVCNRIKGVHTSTQKFTPPDITDLIFMEGMAAINERRLAYRKRFIKKGCTWHDRRDRSLIAAKNKERRHPRTEHMLLKAITETFDIRKQLLTADLYIKRYILLLENATPTNCECVLVYK